MSVCLACTTIAPAATNLLANGDFAGGVSHWHCHRQDGAAATWLVESVRGDLAAIVSVTATGAPHHVQFTTPVDGARLKPGHLYMLSLRARVEAPCTATVGLIGAQKPWGNAGLKQQLAFSPDWQEYRLLFRGRDPGQRQLKLDFFLGRCGGRLWLDDLVLAAHPGDPPRPEGPALATDTSEVRFSRRGAIAHLTHRASGQLVVGGIEAASAYRITLSGKGVARTLTTAEAEAVTTAGGAARRTFTYRHDALVVTTTADASAGDDLVRLHIEIENRTGLAVTEIAYPILHCPPVLGADSTDDVLLYPRCDGGIIEAPMQNMGGDRLDDLYPGPLSCQLMAYGDPRGGVYVATHDAGGHVKRFRVRLGVDLQLGISHCLPRTVVEHVRLPYPVVIGTYAGTWYDAAERYRRWAHGQSWCRIPLSERTDLPAWVSAGRLVTLYNPRARKDGTYRFSPAGLRAFLAMLRDAYGLPVVPNNRGWERYGEWCGQEYWPPFPSDQRFREDAGIISGLGGQGMIMLSGYRWTIEKPQPGGSVYSNAECFDAEVAPYVTHAAEPCAPIVKRTTKPGDWHGSAYARLCPATEFAKRLVVESAVRCVRSGYPLVHFDQEVGGPASTSYCAARHHGHPSGYGPWMHEAMADLFARIRRECEPLSPDFALSMEEPNELYIPWLNLCQSRPNGLVVDFPMKRPLTRVVPLFSYLYHDYLVGWVAFYPWRSGGAHTYSLAQGVVAGMMPGLHWESTQGWEVPVRQQFNTLLRNCCALYAGAGREFLVYGRMCKPLPLAVPTRHLKLEKALAPLAVPAVYHSVWELPDGRRAVLLVNPEDEPHDVRLTPGGDAVRVPPLDGRVVPLPMDR